MNSTRKLRILVVDDQAAVCEVVAETVRYAGHDVVGTAEDGVQAVAEAARLRPDLVLMDIMMPKMDGVKAMEKMLGDGSVQRVALMSGEYRSLGYTEAEILQRGALAFFA